MKNKFGESFIQSFRAAVFAACIYGGVFAALPAAAQQPRGYLKFNPVNMAIQDLGFAYEHVFRGKEGQMPVGLEIECARIYTSWITAKNQIDQMWGSSGVFSGVVGLASRGWHVGTYATFQLTPPENENRERVYVRAGLFHRYLTDMKWGLVEAVYDSEWYYIIDNRENVTGLRVTYHNGAPVGFGWLEWYAGGSLRVGVYKREHSTDYGYNSKRNGIRAAFAPHFGFRWMLGHGKSPPES